MPRTLTESDLVTILGSGSWGHRTVRAFIDSGDLAWDVSDDIENSNFESSIVSLRNAAQGTDVRVARRGDSLILLHREEAP